MSKQELIKEFLKQLETESPDFDKHFSQISKACEFANKAHEWQFRKYSGDPFITHPLTVALMLAKEYKDIDLIIAGILHDTVEDSDKISFEDIYSNFWNKIWFIVDWETDKTNYYYKNKKFLFNDKIEKILYWWMQDVRCILLKLADREHNLTSLEWLKPNKQIRMSFETQAIYEPLKKLFSHKKKFEKINYYEEILKHYLSANKIKTASQFKEALMNQTFFGLDNDTFDLVYKNTETIIWKIQDKKVFEKLIETKDFDEKVEIISIEESIDWIFFATIKYKWWDVFKNFNSKLEIDTNRI